MGQHEEGEREDVRRGVARSRLGEVADHEERDLIGDDEADGPERQRQQFAHGGVTEREDRSEPKAGVCHRRQQHDRHRGNADRRTEPERPPQPVVGQDLLDLPAVGTRRGQRQQRGDDDEVRQDRAPGGSEEPATAVQECVGQPGQAVEEDLDQEDPCESRADGSIHVGIDVAADVDRVEPEDQRCSDDGNEGDRGHQHDRHGQYDVGGIVVVGLDERGEQRYERRREQPAEQQVVDDVRCLVGEQVGVAECGLAQDGGEHGDAQEAGDPGDGRAAGNDDVAPQQPTHPSER